MNTLLLKSSFIMRTKKISFNWLYCECNILITNLNGDNPVFRNYPTILIRYNQKGSIGRISSILSSEDINIAIMKVARERKIATMVIEIDSP